MNRPDLDLGYDFEVKEQDRWLPIANGAYSDLQFLPFHRKNHTHHTHGTPAPDVCYASRLSHVTQSYLACPARKTTGYSPVLPCRLGRLVYPIFPSTPAMARCCDLVALGLSPPTYNACSTRIWSSRPPSNQKLLRKPTISSLRLARPGDARRESQCLHPPRSRLHPRRPSARRLAPSRAPTKRTCIQMLTYKILLQSRES